MVHRLNYAVFRAALFLTAALVQVFEHSRDQVPSPVCTLSTAKKKANGPFANAALPHCHRGYP